MDPLSITASIIAVLDVASKIILTCYKYGFAFRNASKVLSRIFEEVKSIRDVLEMLQPLGIKVESAHSSAQTRLPTLKKEPLDMCLEELKALEQMLTIPSLNEQPGPARKALIQTLCLTLKEKDIEKNLAAIGRSLSLAFSVDQRTRLSLIEDLVRKSQDTSLSLEKEVAKLQASFLSNKDHLAEEKIRPWLSAPDPSSNHHRAFEQRHEGTGVWFEKRQEFAEWMNKPKSFVWLYGKPGCGKSILASIIIENLKAHCRPKTETVVAFFYFDFADTEKRKCGNMIRSLITQLCLPNRDVPQALTSLYSSCDNGKTQPPLESLLSLLCEMIQQLQEVFIVLDALDECGEGEKLLNILENIAGWETDGLHILLTSRKDHNIERWIKQICKEQDKVEVQGEEVQNDISAYIRSKTRTDHNPKQWQKYPGLQKEIEDTLNEEADDMFRWVSCQLDSLKTCHSPGAIRQALKSLPRTLDETYARILCNVKEDESQYVLRILHLLTHSVRPLSLAELAEAVVVNVNENPRFDVENRLFQPECILMICSSLITVENAAESSSVAGTSVTVKLAHYSVKEYLESERILKGPAKAFGIQAGEANACIAEICLAYLLQFDKPDSLTSLPPNDFPFALYAAESWIHHVLLADSETSIYHSLSVELLAGGKEAFLNWVRLCEIHRMQNIDLIKSLDEICPPFCRTSVVGLFKPVKLLLHRGADIYAHGGRYRSAVDVASRLHYERVMRVLRDKRAGINAQENHDPFLLAIGYPFVDVMRSLFDEPKYQSTKWRNPLDVACFLKNSQAVQLLLDKRADFNIGKEDISSALEAASCAGDIELVQILLDNGADINVRSGPYGNPLQMAVYWDHEDVARLLLDKGADINAVGGLYGNALAAASCGGSEDLVRLLLENGADVNAHDVGYGTPLQTAIFFSSEKVVRVLLDHGAHVNDQGGYCGTPIAAAIWLDWKEMVQLLFNNEADISSLNEEALNKAAVLFNFEKCSKSCMRSKLESTLNGNLQTTDCQLHHKMGVVDRTRCCLAEKLL